MQYGPKPPLQSRLPAYAGDPAANTADAFRGGPPRGSHNNGRARRRGVLGWWIDLTAPRLPNGPLPLEAREGLRKAELNSITILLVMAFLLALLSNSLADPSTGEAVGTMAAGLLIAAILNRSGAPGSFRSRFSAYLVPGLMLVLLMAAILQAKGGLRLIWLPAYDLMALPIFISSLTCGRRAPWLFAFLASAFIVGDFLLQPHALINAPGVVNFDEIAYETRIFTLWGMVNRHILLCVFAAFFGWLGARSVDLAIRRADRAEEIAAMEHAIVEQKRQLDYGIQLILDTHVRAANGDFTARAPLTQENVLWQIAASLNNLLARLQRSGVAEHQLRRTDEEIRRLAAAIRDAQQGRTPIWPAPTGTSADLLLELIGRGSGGGQSAREMHQAPPLQAPQGTQPYPQPQSAAYTQAGGYSADGGYGQSMPNAYPLPGAGVGSFAPGHMPASGELRWPSQQQPQPQPQPQAPQNPWTSPDEPS